MPVIRANRDSVDDRFSVLGFTIHTENPLFEVGIATDPELFKPENRSRRTRRNFYSSRSGGIIRARRGEAVYLVPQEVMANFVGNQKVYFGLATYGENNVGRPNFVQSPTAGNMYVNIAGLSERGLRRLAGRSVGSGQGTHSGEASLVWGGDSTPSASAPSSTSPVTSTAPATPPANGAGTPSAAYDDGFGPLPATAVGGNGRSPSGGNGAAVATPAVAAQAYASRAVRKLALSDEEVADDARGIEGPIPDAPLSTGQAARAFTLTTPEYPGANRYAAASPQNYRVSTTVRTIDKVVIHITDGGANINGTIGWFQNPTAQVSAHYVIGQDGEVVQMVAHNDVAWHARTANSHSIGIEHVANTRGLRPTPAQYCASAALVTWLCDQFGIPADRTHILGHAEADPRTSHTGCPNAVWDWGYFMSMVTARQCQEPPAQTQAFAVAKPTRAPLAQAQEIITPYYNPADPSSALTCQNDAFSLAREEWFAGVSNTRIFPHSAICFLEMTDATGNVYNGTGFYIGRNRILTCAHNLHNMVHTVVVPGKNDTQEPFGRFTVTPSSWRVSNRYPASGHEFDLAVIDNVPTPAPNGRWFEFLQQTPSDQMPIVVCGYSAASDAVPDLTAAINGLQQHLHGGYIRSQDNFELIDYPILTLKGASGSPVYTLRQDGNTLKALIAGVHVSGAPAARGLNRGCFITPTKIDWIEGRVTALSHPISARSRALSGESYTLNWDGVQLIPQPTDVSCWAAAAAMVISWRDLLSLDADGIAQITGRTTATGLDPAQVRPFANEIGLVYESPQSYSIEGFRRLLDTKGPLWVGASVPGLHAIVVTGIYSDGAEDGSDTYVRISDPWDRVVGQPGAAGTYLKTHDTGSRYILSWAQFVSEYEAAATDYAQVNLQILHSGGTAGRQPNRERRPYGYQMAQSLGTAQPGLEATGGEHPTAPPAPKTRSLTVGADAAIAIAGVALERIVNNEGDITWELDQFRGIKHPNDQTPSPAPPFRDANIIRLTDWPKVENNAGDEISAGFTVEWQYNGASLGNVRITNVATNDAIGQGLVVRAQIMDDNAVYPSQSDAAVRVAALRVRFVYRFTRPIGSDWIAVRDIHLYGDGTSETSGRWEQQ